MTMYGDQAVRLIRENWGGKLLPDVNGDLVEKGATQLAEELYAMLDDAIPQTQNAPLTMNKTNPNAPGLTINNAVGGNSLAVNGGATTLTNSDFTYNNPAGSFNVAGNTVNIGGNTVNIGGNTINLGNQGTIPPSGGGGGGGGGGTRPTFITFPPLPNLLFPDPVTGELTPTLADLAGGAGTTVFLGKVVSGSGSSYMVALYGNGPAAAATETVPARCMQIDPAETIPAGTWLAAVHGFVRDPGGDNPTRTFAFQVPVWLGA